MSEVFGVVSPAVVIFIITTITQWVKKTYQNLNGKQIQYVALGLAFLFIIPFELIFADVVTARVIYSSIIYAILGWLSAIGAYEVVSKQFGSTPVG